jgi:CRP-like cAMP-binding protein
MTQTNHQPPMQGAQMEFVAGTTIFREGDPGGDLFFVREGEVEVFKEIGGAAVPLAVLKSGEILGVMTCMTREPRLASARARTDVKVLVVKQAGIRSLVSATPPWVNTVIKDFILRIKQMDDLYARAVRAASGQADAADTGLQLAVTLASGISEVGRLILDKDGGNVVDVNRALQHLAKILDVPPATLERIFDTFIDVGLLRSGADGPTRRAEIAVLERLLTFAAFGRELLRNPASRRAYDSLSAKHCQYLVQAADKARQVTGAPADKPVLVNVADIVPEGTSKELLLDLFERLAPTQACDFVDEDHVQVAFTPGVLNNNVRSMVAIQKIRIFDRQRAATKDKDSQDVRIITENF